MRWTDYEINYLKDNYNKLGRAECAKMLNRSIDSVSTKIRDGNFNLKSKEVWLESDLKFLIENYTINGVDFCVKNLNCSRRRIIYKANSLGLKTNVIIKSESKTKKSVNYELFDNNMSKESVYILGLLWADGHVRKDNKTTSISCILKDMENVYPIFLKTGDWLISNPIKKYFKGNEVKTQKKIHTTTWGLYEILKKYGYLNKSVGVPNKMLSKIPNDLRKYWFRGYLDGDGCIRLGKKYGSSIVFSGPYSQDWGFMVNLCKELNIHYLIDRRIVNLGGHSYFTVYRKNDVKVLGDYLYSDYDGIGLSRKHKKYLDVIERIQNKKPVIL